MRLYIYKQAQRKFSIKQSICEVLTMSHSIRRSLKEQEKTFSDAMKDTVIEKIIRNLKQNIILPSPAETTLKDAKARIELILAPTTVIRAVKDVYIQVDLMDSKIDYDIAAMQSLCNRWLKVTEGYQRQKRR